MGSLLQSSDAMVLSLLDEWCSLELVRRGFDSVPVDLQAYARKLGVAEIRHEEMRAWGYVQRLGAKSNIVLRKGAPLTRERFSLAHEIGHLMLDKFRDPSSDVPFRQFRSSPGISSTVDEERYANHIAGCLLLPSWFIRPYLRDSIDIRAIQRAASQAQASLSAALVRVVGVAMQPCVAYMTRQAGFDRRRVVWLYPSPSLPRAAIASDLARDEVLEGLIDYGEADDPSLKCRWIKCQCVSNMPEAGITDHLCLAIAEVKKNSRAV